MLAEFMKEVPMKKAFLLGLAVFALALPAYAEDVAPAATTEPTAPTAPSSTQVVVPPATTPTVVEVEKSVPRDAITGQPVDETPTVEKEKSLRDEVRDKMKD